jgi:EmrB/QacA subfamily drug resistance transporter
MSVVTLPALVAPIFGPMVGGLIVGHASWRWIFYINVPICLAGALLAWRALSSDPPARGARLDVPGLLLLSPAVAALVYGLAQVGSLGGFAHPAVIAPLAAGTVLLAGFIAWALRAQTPLVDLRLFRVRSFAASSGLLFLSGLSMYGSMLLLPLYYQQVHGASVIGAGLLMAPQGVGSLLARGAGALTDRFGPRPVLLAAIVATAVGTLPFVVAGQVNAVLLAAALVVRGAGLSAANMAVMVGAYRDVDRAQIPHASTTTRIAQQVGASFGTAVLAVILQSQLTAHPGSVGVRIAYGHTFLWALIFAAASLIPALLLPRTPKAERS